MTNAGEKPEDLPQEESIQTPMDKVVLHTARAAPSFVRAVARLGNAIERRRSSLTSLLKSTCKSDVSVETGQARRDARDHQRPDADPVLVMHDGQVRDAAQLRRCQERCPPGGGWRHDAAAGHRDGSSAAGSPAQGDG